MSNFSKLIQSILSNEVFEQKPPVLIDIGASGEIFYKWKLISDKSICIAFDADDRDFLLDEVKEATGYLKLYKFNRIVLPTDSKECTFYLTNSPYCSSTLKPDQENLKNWMFAPLFKVEKELKLPCVTVNQCLQNIQLDYIDWYKVDSQGIDMDLFLSIKKDVRDNILAADFEPGIMDAYLNENKLAELLVMLDKESYWISSFDVKGTQRLNPKYSAYSKNLHESPCWAGITSLKEINQAHDLRSALLLIVFSLIEDQWGYALQICDLANQNNPIFASIHSSILAIIKQKEKVGFDKTGRKAKNFIKRIIFGRA